MELRMADLRLRALDAWAALLRWSAFSVSIMHILAGILVFADARVSAALLAAERAAVFLTAGAALAGAVWVWLRAPSQMARIGGFLRKLFCPELLILVFLFLWQFVSAASFGARDAAALLAENDAEVFDTFVRCFFLFTAACLAGDNARKVLEALFHLLTLLLTVVMLYILWRVFQGEAFRMPGGNWVGMGIDIRLYPGCNANVAAAYAEILIMVCLYMISVRRGFVRALYFPALAVHYVVLILTNCRNCLLVTAFVAAVLAFRKLFAAMCGRRDILRFGASAAAALAVFALILGLRAPVFCLYEAASHRCSSLGTDALSAMRPIVLTTTGRTQIWKASAKIVFSDMRHVLFGVTPANIARELDAVFTEYPAQHTHNQYLQIAVANGLPAVAAFLSWLYLLANTCMRIVRGRAENGYRGLCVAAGILLMLVLSNLYEPMLLYYRDLPGDMLFLLGGFIVYRYGGRKAPAPVRLSLPLPAAGRRFALVSRLFGIF